MAHNPAHGPWPAASLPRLGGPDGTPPRLRLGVHVRDRGGPKERAGKAIAGSDAVFSGEVVELEKAPPDTQMVEGTMMTIIGGGGREAAATLLASEVWKGPKQQTVRFTTPVADGTSCAHPFKEEREYPVYANGIRTSGSAAAAGPKRSPTRTWTSPCSGTAQH